MNTQKVIQINLIGSPLKTTLLLCLLCLTSCTSTVGNYNPKPALAKGVGKGLKFSKPITIVNAQTSHEEQKLDFMGIVVNYQDFTQALVDALKSELTTNGTTVSEMTDKKLHVSVRKVEIPPPCNVFKAYIDVDVTTGNGQMVRFSTNRSSYASPFNMGTAPTKPLNAAFRDMVEKILTNNDIQSYINN